MKNKDKKQFYSGKTTFMDKEIPFEMDGFAMRLFVDTDILRKVFFEEVAEGAYTLKSNTEPLYTNNLKCYTNDGVYYLSVFFEKSSYAAENIMTQSVGTFIIYFHHLIISNLLSRNLDKHNYIGILSKNFYKFLDMVPNYKIDDIVNAKFSIDLDFPIKKRKTHISYKGIDIEIHPYPQWSCNYSSLDYTPGLSFKFDGLMDEETLISFIDNWLKMLRFLFMRNNINPDRIHIMIGLVDSELFIYHQQQEKDVVEDLNKAYSDSISWNDICDSIPKLFELICNDDLYLFNLKNSIRERLSAGIFSASLDAAAFESEFGKLYPNGFKHKEKTLLAENESLSEIDALLTKSSGKKRAIYKKLRERVRSESLQDKMEMAFDDNKDCLVLLKSKFASKLDYELISDVCANFRNNVDHGNRHGMIDDQLVCCFIMLRGLVYSMQLRRCGLDNSKINSIVFKLFNIKF